MQSNSDRDQRDQRFAADSVLSSAGPVKYDITNMRDDEDKQEVTDGVVAELNEAYKMSDEVQKELYEAHIATLPNSGIDGIYYDLDIPQDVAGGYVPDVPKQTPEQNASEPNKRYKVDHNILLNILYDEDIITTKTHEIGHGIRDKNNKNPFNKYITVSKYAGHDEAKAELLKKIIADGYFQYDEINHGIPDGLSAKEATELQDIIDPTSSFSENYKQENFAFKNDKGNNLSMFKRRVPNSWDEYIAYYGDKLHKSITDRVKPVLSNASLSENQKKNILTALLNIHTIYDNHIKDMYSNTAGLQQRSPNLERARHARRKSIDNSIALMSDNSYQINKASGGYIAPRSKHNTMYEEEEKVGQNKAADGCITSSHHHSKKEEPYILKVIRGDVKLPPPRPKYISMDSPYMQDMLKRSAAYARTLGPRRR